MILKVKVLNTEFWENFPLPNHATTGSAGMDLRITEDIVLEPGETKLAGTGLAFWIENPNYVGMIYPRSGLGHKGLVLGNLTGVIDSDYQGELKMSLWNRSETRMVLGAGDRVAQLVILPFVRVEGLQVVNDFEESERGGDGYGSTGEK